MPTTLRLIFLLMLGIFGLQPVGYGYDAPVTFVSGAQNIVAVSPESQTSTADSAASAPLNFNRDGAVSGRQAETRAISDFVAADKAASTEPTQQQQSQQQQANPNGGKPSSAGKMQKEVERDQAPAGVDRVDGPHPGADEPHVHYDDGTSSTQSGGTHDAGKGTPNPSNKIRAWLESHGWKAPPKPPPPTSN